MYLNETRLTPATTVNQPAIQVLYNGSVILGAIKASVRQVAHFHADTFDIEFSLDNATFPLSWWSDTTDIILDVQIGLAKNGSITWQSMITGQVDHIQSQLSTRTVHVEGRDLSAKLIDLKIQESYPNKTASEIAEILAGLAGIPNTDITPTTTIVGKYYAGDHDTITNGEFSKATRAWDLLTNLAQRERYDVWVSGTTLHFKPIDAADPTPWLVRYQPPQTKANTSYSSALTTPEVGLERSLTLAKDLVVVVIGWSSGEGKVIRAVYPDGKNTSLHAAKSSTIQKVFNIANLKDHAEALKLAQSYYADIVKNERVINWREPGDLNLTPRNMAELQGTQTSFDQIYYIDTITRNVSVDGGFTMDVRAKNQSTVTETLVG